MPNEGLGERKAVFIGLERSLDVERRLDLVGRSYSLKIDIFYLLLSIPSPPSYDCCPFLSHRLWGPCHGAAYMSLNAWRLGACILAVMDSSKIQAPKSQAEDPVLTHTLLLDVRKWPLHALTWSPTICNTQPNEKGAKPEPNVGEKKKGQNHSAQWWEISDLVAFL